MKELKKEICKFVWWLSEELHIPLGRFAVPVFDCMMGQKGRELFVFANGVTEWIIATSSKDAETIVTEMTGEEYLTEDSGEFGKLESTDRVSIMFEHVSELGFEIDERYVTERGDNYVKMTAPAAAWIRMVGRGWLCSTEY